MGRLAGIEVLITAGPTREWIDPVRYLSNASTGALGYALAKAAASRGAQVTLISGPTDLLKPSNVKIIQVESAKQMHKACLKHRKKSKIIIMAAAVADYRIANIQQQKIKRKKSSVMNLKLVANPDILAEICKLRLNEKNLKQYIVGFALETKDIVKSAKIKLKEKGCDMIIANHAKSIGSAKHQATIITESSSIPLSPLSKQQLANRLLSTIIAQADL